MTTEIPEFLDLEDVLELHALHLARYGGADGARDRGVLESALAQAQAKALAGSWGYGAHVPAVQDLESYVDGSHVDWFVKAPVLACARRHATLASLTFA